jgi:hypothetical protein
MKIRAQIGASGPTVRTRTYTWTDPSATLAAITGLPGIELLSAIGRGELPPPPVMRTLGFEPVEVGEAGSRSR